MSVFFSPSSKLKELLVREYRKQFQNVCQLPEGYRSAVLDTLLMDGWIVIQEMFLLFQIPFCRNRFKLDCYPYWMVGTSYQQLLLGLVCWLRSVCSLQDGDCQGRFGNSSEVSHKSCSIQTLHLHGGIARGEFAKLQLSELEALFRCRRTYE